MAETKRKRKAHPKRSEPAKKETEKPKRKFSLSPEKRKERSEAMKKRIAEGKAGPQFGKLGGRPKKKRASEVVAEKAQENGEKIAQVFLDAMDENNPHSIRVKGAEGMLKIEKDESRLQMDEEEHFAKMGRSELEAELVKMFKENPMLVSMFKNAAAGALSAESQESDDDVIDVEVIEDDEAED